MRGRLCWWALSCVADCLPPRRASCSVVCNGEVAMKPTNRASLQLLHGARWNEAVSRCVLVSAGGHCVESNCHHNHTLAVWSATVKPHMAASTLHPPSARGRDEHATRGSSPPPPCIVEKVQACLTSRSFGRLHRRGQTPHLLQVSGHGGKHSPSAECSRQRRAHAPRVSSLPPPCIVE